MRAQRPQAYAHSCTFMFIVIVNFFICPKSNRALKLFTVPAETSVVVV